jgi:hypothetical protein
LPRDELALLCSPVGNPGNAADPTTGFGAVGYSYNIGKFDITVSQYVEFLNAKDPNGTNSLGLWSSSGTFYATYNGISFSPGNPAGSKYGVISGDGNHPVNFVGWYSAIRFANWLNNGGLSTSDTETGDTMQVIDISRVEMVNG